MGSGKPWRKDGTVLIVRHPFNLPSATLPRSGLLWARELKGAWAETEAEGHSQAKDNAVLKFANTGWWPRTAGQEVGPPVCCGRCGLWGSVHWGLCEKQMGDCPATSVSSLYPRECLGSEASTLFSYFWDHRMLSSGCNGIRSLRGHLRPPPVFSQHGS